MTDDLRFERLARDWLELGPSEAPPEAVQAALERINTTRQVHAVAVPRRIGWRQPGLGVAAVVALLAVARLVPFPQPANVTPDLRPAGAALTIPPTWAVDDRVAWTIRGPELDRVTSWRATTYDRVLAGGWSQTDARWVTRPAGGSLLAGTFDDPGAEERRGTVTVTVTPSTEARALPLVAPGVPVAADQPVKLTLLGSAGFLGAVERDDLGASPTYRITSTVSRWGRDASERDAAVLRSAGTDYPAEIVERYLQLDGDVLGPNVTDLRIRVAAEARSRSPFDLALAAESLLRSPEFTYSVDVRDLECRSVSIAECFAMNRQGYCLHFATTMAVILRDLGVPTRLVQGFLPGTVTGDVAVVRDRDAHAWVEVYFPESGWVAFDPTGGLQPVQAPPGP